MSILKRTLTVEWHKRDKLDPKVGLQIIAVTELGLSTLVAFLASLTSGVLIVNCSTKGVGRVAPDPKEYKTLEDGVIVPSGSPVEGNHDNKVWAHLS